MKDIIQARQQKVAKHEQNILKLLSRISNTQLDLFQVTTDSVIIMTLCSIVMQRDLIMLCYNYACVL